LNLLAVFVAIAEELNLSGASDRVGLSQPALSHALSRLREQFADPLFVRGQRGLIATPKVGVLLPQVRALLAMAENLYGPGEILNLAKLNRKVVIASTTYFEARAIAGFIKHAQTKAPSLQLETRSLSGGFPKRELESGEFDLAIAAYFDDIPNGFKIKTVFSDRFVCVCSKKNAYFKTKRTTADYLGRKHLQIEVPPGVFAPVDQYLEGKKQRRDISLRIGNFLTPPAILDKSDFLLTCPLSLAENYKEVYPLIITELPFWLPAIDTKMVWHEKNQRDPFHVWLRDCMAS
jgi:DNA-binding transcriptional LysR family regulator